MKILDLKIGDKIHFRVPYNEGELRTAKIIQILNSKVFPLEIENPSGSKGLLRLDEVIKKLK